MSEGAAFGVVGDWGWFFSSFFAWLPRVEVGLVGGVVCWRVSAELVVGYLNLWVC